jgi:hypothetical protein
MSNNGNEVLLGACYNVSADEFEDLLPLSQMSQATASGNHVWPEDGSHRVEESFKDGSADTLHPRSFLLKIPSTLLPSHVVTPSEHARSSFGATSIKSHRGKMTKLQMRTQAETVLMSAERNRFSPD